MTKASVIQEPDYFDNEIQGAKNQPVLKTVSPERARFKIEKILKSSNPQSPLTLEYTVSARNNDNTWRIMGTTTTFEDATNIVNFLYAEKEVHYY